MSWSAKFLTKAEVQAEIDSGVFEDLYNASKDDIENGNYSYGTDDLTEAEKLNHWQNIMLNYADNAVIPPLDKTYRYTVLGVYKDNVCKLLHSGFLDSDTRYWNTDHGLVGTISDSKSWVFSKECWSVQTAVIKSTLSATHWNFIANKSSAIAFRILTADVDDDSFDYETKEEVEKSEVISISQSSAEPLPTEDGSVKTNDNIEQESYQTDEVHITIELK